jgi:hypothetical protein
MVHPKIIGIKKVEAVKGPNFSTAINICQEYEHGAEIPQEYLQKVKNSIK